MARRTDIRNMIWPRMGLPRYASYLKKKILRLSASPHAIAAGAASGAAVSMLPLIGLHFFLGFVLAFISRGNMVAAAVGTAWGNPLTFPFFFAAAFGVGNFLLGGGADNPGRDNLGGAAAQMREGLFSGGLEAVWPLFQTMMVGGLIMAALVYAAFYFLIRWLVVHFRAVRQARIAARREARREAEAAAARGEA